jgi:hypothetical protein
MIRDPGSHGLLRDVLLVSLMTAVLVPVRRVDLIIALGATTSLLRWFENSRLGGQPCLYVS